MQYAILRIWKRVFQENKARQIFRKTNISYLLIRTRTCAYQGVTNIPLSENLKCFVFLKHPFWDLLFCRITDELRIARSGTIHQRNINILTAVLFKIKIILYNQITMAQLLYKRNSAVLNWIWKIWVKNTAIFRSEKMEYCS